MPFKSFETYKTFDSIIENFTDRLENRMDSKNKLSKKVFIQRELKLVNDSISDFKKNSKTYNILIAYLPWLENKLEVEGNKKSRSVNSFATGKLLWNEDKHLLTNLFYQLKRVHNKKNERLLPNTVDEIATFLKMNFDCFKETKISTIKTQLTKEEKQPSRVKINLQINYP